MNNKKTKVAQCLTILVGLILATLLGTSCKKSNTYADYVDDQKDEISSFLSKNKISVTGAMPEDSTEWKDGDNDVYYLYSSGKADGLYFHLCDKGYGDLEPQTNWTAYVRYKGYSLSGDLVYDCTAGVNPDPLSFVILSDAYGASYGRGFQQAVKNLRVGGHCKVIIPFSIGNSTLTTVTGGTRSDYENYQPMFYEIWLVGLE